MTRIYEDLVEDPQKDLYEDPQRSMKDFSQGNFIINVEGDSTKSTKAVADSLHHLKINL